MNYPILILTLLILSLASTQTDPIDLKLSSAANHLPYQAHSYNDLDITRHLLLKGVKYFKFDVSLADKPSCLKYSNWDGKSQCFNSQHYSQEVCCLAMRGDAGSQNNFYYYFNTTDDFIKLMSSYLSNYGQKLDVLFAAINFQFPFQMNNHLLEGFLYQISQLLQKYKMLRIATGEDDFIFEYDRICRQASQNGQSLNDISCTPTRKAISDSSIMLQSGGMHPYDSRDYKGRYRNFNTYYKNVDQLCKNGFPTWQNKYPQIPLIFWEPSNEDQIQNTLRKLLSPSCAKLHNRTIQGIALASNIDPQMFQIFAKEINQKDMANQFPWSYLHKKLWIENATNIKLTTIDGVYTQVSNSKERLVVSWQRNESSILKNYLSLFYWNDQKDQINIQKTIEYNQQIQQLYSIKDTIIVITKDDDNESSPSYYKARITSLNSRLERLKSIVLFDSYIISYTDGQVIYYMIRTSNPNYFNLYVINRELNNITQYGTSNYMSKDQMSSITSLFFKKGQKIDDDIFLLFGESNDHTWIAQMKLGNIHKEKTLTFGKNAKIIDIQDGNIVISLEDSYSHSGVLLNNNAQNKCRFHLKQASQRLAHLPTLVNVIEGSLENLMKFLNSQSEDIITACYPSLTFSKHMNGAKVDIASAWGQLFLSSEYVPLNKQDLMVSLFSGGSNYEPALRTKTGFILTSVNANQRFRKTDNVAIQQE